MTRGGWTPIHRVIDEVSPVFDRVLLEMGRHVGLPAPRAPRLPQAVLPEALPEALLPEALLPEALHPEALHPEALPEALHPEPLESLI